MEDRVFFAKRIGLMGIVNLFMGLSGILLLPVLSKSLPVADYGTWAQVSVTIGLVPLVVTMGLPYTMVRFLAPEKDRQKVSDSFYTMLAAVSITSLLFSAGLLALAEPVAKLLFNGYILVTQLLAIVVFLECVNLFLTNYFRAFQQIKRFALLSILRTLLMVLFATAFVFAGYGVAGAVAGLVVMDLTMLALMATLILHEIGVRLSGFTDIRAYLRFGLPIIPGGVSSWVVDASDRYVIGGYLGTAYVGYYSPGYSLGSMISMFVSPISSMLTAPLSQYYEERNIGEVQRVLGYSLKYFLVAAIPAAFGVTLLSKPLLLVLSTAEIADQGYLVTPVVAAGALVYGAFVILSEIIMLEKKTHITGTLWMVVAALNLGLNLVLVPLAGIIAAAATTLFAYAVALALVVIVSRRYVTVRLKPAFLAKSIIASLVMSAVVLFLAPQGALPILATVAVAALVYFAVLLAIGGFKKEEIAFFMSLAGIRK